MFHSNYCITSSDLQITFNICLGQNYKAAQRCGQEDSSGTVNLISSEIKIQLSLQSQEKVKNHISWFNKMIAERESVPKVINDSSLVNPAHHIQYKLLVLY